MTHRPDDEMLLRRLREAFPAAHDPRDDALARLIGNSPAPQPAGAWRSRLTERLREAFAPRRAAAWGALAAACFVLGLAVGWLGQDRTSQGFAVAADGAIADTALVRVLDRGLAADGTDDEGRAVGLTFRDAGGRWCRTFEAGEAGVAGLACRHEDDWRMQALAPFRPSGSEVRTAGADTPEPVLAAVDALIAGETLDAAAETRARDAGWR